MTECAMVITTSFSERAQWVNMPRNHWQDNLQPIDIIDQIKAHLHYFRTMDPGIDLDLIIANNGTHFEEGNKFLDSIDGSDIYRGQIRIVHRDNVGRSFGGYAGAFAEHGNHYKYWGFSEDDVLICWPGYFGEAVDLLKQDKHLGYLALAGLSVDPEVPRHAHGGMGITTQSVLDHVIEECGRLPYPDVENADVNIAKSQGEIPWTNNILRLGYKLKSLDHRTKYGFRKNFVSYWHYTRGYRVATDKSGNRITD